MNHHKMRAFLDKKLAELNVLRKAVDDNAKALRAAINGQASEPYDDFIKSVEDAAKRLEFLAKETP